MRPRSGDDGLGVNGASDRRMDLGHLGTAGGIELTKIAERGWGTADDAAWGGMGSG